MSAAPLQGRSGAAPTWSHQHSLKLGSWCSRLYSRNSNVTLMMVHIHHSRIIRVCGPHSPSAPGRGLRPGGRGPAASTCPRCPREHPGPWPLGPCPPHSDGARRQPVAGEWPQRQMAGNPGTHCYRSPHAWKPSAHPPTFRYQPRKCAGTKPSSLSCGRQDTQVQVVWGAHLPLGQPPPSSRAPPAVPASPRDAAGSQAHVVGTWR